MNLEWETIMTDGISAGYADQERAVAYGIILLSLRRYLINPSEELKQTIKSAADEKDSVSGKGLWSGKSSNTWERIEKRINKLVEKDKTEWLKLLYRWEEESEMAEHVIVLSACNPSFNFNEEYKKLFGNSGYENFKSLSPFNGVYGIHFTEDGGGSLREISNNLFNEICDKLDSLGWRNCRSSKSNPAPDWDDVYAVVIYSECIEVYWIGRKNQFEMDQRKLKGPKKL